MLIASPVLSFSQYFQQLYDVDSAQNWGWNLFIQQDANYFVLGWSFNQYIGLFSIYNAHINSTNQEISNINPQYPINPSNCIGFGNPGEVKKNSFNQYVMPFVQQWPDPITHYLYSAAGVAKLDVNGNMIFAKVYTDTSVFFDRMNTCAITSNSQGYLIGGGRGTDTPSNPVAHLVRTDTTGDTLWTRSYQKDVSERAAIDNVIPLSDGQIVVGAMSTYLAVGGSYYHNTPWFLELDSMGNIIKDTSFTVGYLVGAEDVCNELYADKNGGYINIGQLDILYDSDPSDARSFPGYIAHLDTNFRITWVTSFPFSDADGNRGAATVRQLKDSSYLVIGDSYGNVGYNKGFAAKISRTGSIVWSHNYYSSTIGDAYLCDGVERPDGGFILTGQAANDTLPSWHQHYDMWLVGVDSNGCEDGLCAPAAVPAAPQPVVKSNELLVWPNPTNGMLNFEFVVSGNVTIKLMDLTGRVLNEQVISNSTNTAFDVKNYAAGLYLYQVITDGKTQSGKFIVR